jgi:hypothetical protein
MVEINSSPEIEFIYACSSNDREDAGSNPVCIALHLHHAALMIERTVVRATCLFVVCFHASRWDA